MQAPDCVIRIEVLESNHADSDGHKVKVQGVVIADVPSKEGDIPERPTSILHLMGGALIAERKEIGRRLLRKLWPAGRKLLGGMRGRSVGM